MFSNCARLATLFLTALSAGCSRQDTLQPVESIAIRNSELSALLGGGDPGIWMSGPEGHVLLRPDSFTAYRLRPRHGDRSRVLGEVKGHLILADGDAAMAMSPDSAAPYPLLRGIEAAALATAHGVLLQSVRRGQIVVSPLDSLCPAWGWADIGAVSTALALSPEGDRLYQAVDGVEGGAGPLLIIRDMLSGRVLGTVETGEPFRALEVTSGGNLIGVAWDGERSGATVARLQWEGGALRNDWSSDVPAPASTDALRFAIAADGRRVAISGYEEAGLTLLDGETGFIIAAFNGQTRDVVFDAQGRLYALTDSAVLRFSTLSASPRRRDR